MSAMKKKPVKKVTMRPGLYWLGDPCHVLEDDAWDHWLRKVDEECGEDPDMLVATLPSRRRVVAFAVRSDGIFVGADGFRYPVDAGLIGLVPVAAPEFLGAGPRLGQYVTFAEKAICFSDNGTLRFGDIPIRID